MVESVDRGGVGGVGAPSATRAEAEIRAQARAARPPAQRDLEDRAEAEQMLRLFRDENVDPDFDAAVYRPSFEVRDRQLLNGAP